MENKTFESGQYEQSYDQHVMHHQPMVTQTTVHPAQDVVIVAQPRSYGQPQNQTDWNEGLCGCLSDCGSCKKLDGICISVQWTINANPSRYFQACSRGAAFLVTCAKLPGR